MNKTKMKKLINFLKPYIPFMVFSLIASAVAVVMQLYAPIISGRAIDLIAGKGNVNISKLTEYLTRFFIV
ncbi:MAG: ABC transporter ATP-binding protein, partial [Eubacterium sp.]|nr:ABC transporter ATP-binding protein [Eubacterium sp.]